MGFVIHQTVGDYTILEDLGLSGAGQGYKVEHTITRRREVMKVLAGEGPCPVEQADRFFREIRLQASLSHPNIAAVHNAFWVEDDLVLVCELLDGESLHNALERGRLPFTQSLDIISQVLAALGHAHAHGIIHRGVSPANIFLTGDGTVKLIDFGLAKSGATGPLHCMSPEQVRGEDTLDVRSDLYACGVVLYEMVTGAKPFTGEEALRLPHSVDPTLPKEIDGIVELAIASKPEQRFQSADAFQNAVARLRHSLAHVTTPGHSFTRRRAALVAAAAGLLLIFAVSGSVHPTTQRDIPPQQVSATSVTALPAPSPTPPPTPTPRPTPPPLPKQSVVARPAQTKEPPPATSLAAASPSPLVKVGRALKRVNPFRRTGAPKAQLNNGEQP